MTTCLNSVLSSPQMADDTSLHPCNHEEADTRIMLHVKHCVSSGLTRVMIRTTDTDVVVLATACCHRIPATSIWVAFGVGKNFQYIGAHEIAVRLGPGPSKALPAFHALTGCDTVSFFAGKGKAKAWEVWMAFPQATEAFLYLASGPDALQETYCETLEQFVVLIYDKTSSVTIVNEARQHLFSRQGRSLENIPPTKAALTQHVLRAAYQSGYVWGQCLQKHQNLPDPALWGWENERAFKSKLSPGQEGMTRKWLPVWTTLDQAANSCYELIHCSCKQGCRGRCKCMKASLRCTALCNCGGNC